MAQKAMTRAQRMKPFYELHKKSRDLSKTSRAELLRILDDCDAASAAFELELDRLGIPREH